MSTQQVNCTLNMEQTFLQLHCATPVTQRLPSGSIESLVTAVLVIS